jgi:hypothetical protein
VEKSSKATLSGVPSANCCIPKDLKTPFCKVPKRYPATSFLSSPIVFKHERNENGTVTELTLPLTRHEYQGRVLVSNLSEIVILSSAKRIPKRFVLGIDNSSRGAVRMV